MILPCWRQRPVVSPAARRANSRFWQLIAGTRSFTWVKPAVHACPISWEPAGLASYGGGGFDSYLQMMSRVRQTPMITAILGECYGMPTWMACLSDFVVQVKGSAMGVSGPRVVELALGESVTDEELGGWRVHAEITGNVDRVAQNEAECFQIIRQYLSYMPSHCDELPPRVPAPEGSGSNMGNILDLLPEQRNRGYDMHRLLSCIVDDESLFAIKPAFGKSVITALARIGGGVVGLVANQPMHNAGAMDTDGIDKVISFLCLCDSFNIPLVFFHDIPGFLVGKEAERKRVAARVMNYMNALGLVDGSQNFDCGEKNIRNGILEHVRLRLRGRFSGSLALSGNELCGSCHRCQCGLWR